MLPQPKGIGVFRSLYKINHNSQERKNFIFLVNPDDVPKAVKQQFLNYNLNPTKYGLDPDPTIEDIIKLFDQTGAKDKIKFLKEKIQNFDETIKLEDVVISS